MAGAQNGPEDNHHREAHFRKLETVFMLGSYLMHLQGGDSARDVENIGG